MPASPRKLLLVRHAKSSWANEGLDDFERPLSARGRRDGPRMAQHLAEHGPQPDRVLCSPARRTEETWAAFAPKLPDVEDVEFVPDLYLASPSVFLGHIQSQPLDVGCLMIVSHNPGTQITALRLCGGGDADALDQIREKLPTGALVEIEFPFERWGEVDWGTGLLRSFVVPRQL